MRISTVSPFALALLLTPFTHAYTGEMTFYNPSAGLGSCGYTPFANHDNEDV
ncbi:MAG: hypothetical protein Q9226_009406, partial [Calogaya cf. arnoldii]